KKLNHPVIQLANGPRLFPANINAQKYKPPEVGYEEQISAILRPTIKVMKDTSGQPHIITTGPPFSKPDPYNEDSPVKIEMIENETEKFANDVSSLFSSCL
ncbi:hypothetical protein K7432_012921, partial [Basidiobolus ranarum]